jgi:hypothetical protein
MNNNSDYLGLSGFNIGQQNGNIVSVTFKAYLNEVANFAAGDRFLVRVYYSDAQIGADYVYNGMYLSGPAGTSYVLSQDITGLRTWTWPNFANNLTEMQVVGDRGPGSTGDAGLDAVAYIITTDQQCGGSDTTIATLPFTDTYDANRLQFVSASLPQNSVSTGGTSPYANTGVISWNDLGPLYAGQTKRVTVTFAALQPPNNTTTVITNTVCSTGAAFGSGAPVHSACDAYTHTVAPTGSIGDYVWRDLNGDGNQDGGNEVGIANVVVSMTANVTITVGGAAYAPGTVVTTTTSATGYYLFSGLRYSGTYTVRVNTATLPVGTGTFTNTWDYDNGTTNPNSRAVFGLNPRAAGGGDNLDVDFGYQLNTIIEGTVWHDRDRSGTAAPDSGEEWLSGIAVYLDDGSCTYPGTCLTASTDASGYFQFVGSFTGTYTVTVDTATGPLVSGSWSQSYDGPSGGALDSAVPVTVVAGGRGRADFSYYQYQNNVDIGDTLYRDWDGDGVQDTAEGGIPNVTVWLYEDNDGNGVVDVGIDARVMTTTTSATGYYLFEDLPAGNYTVVVDETDPGLPTSYSQTADPDQPGVACSTCDGKGRVALVSTSVLTADFGYWPTGYGSIGDFVWRDLDRDGIQDGGSETGIANILVTLYADDGDGVFELSEDARVMTATTNASGTYLFSGLPAGSFWVDVDTADSDLPVDGSGNRYVLSTNNDPRLVNLSAFENYLSADFGFTPAGMIGDTIWQDNDGDGVQDEAEPGIAGVTVRLYIDTDGDGTGDVLSATKTTDASGVYSFTGIVSGTYVVVVDTSGPLSSFQQTGDPDLSSVCSGGNCDSQSAFSLRAGQIDMSRDFGYQPPGVIGDFVWFDMDGDGVQDPGEPGLGGVVLTLTRPSGPPITTITDSDGYYSFGNLSNGTYTVSVDTGTLPAFITQPTFDRDGGNDHQATVTLSGSNILDVDFGYRYSGSHTISGTVFFDAGGTGDGVSDIYSSSVDMPYSNVTVYLWDSAGLRIGTMTTTVTGAFTFTNLAGGGLTYTMSLNPDSPQLSGLGLTASVNPGHTYNTVTINASSVTGQDFGFYASMDFGDLPSSYNATLLADEGPYHISGTLRLGSMIDTEGDGTESDTAEGDEYDDGVARSGAWSDGTDGGSVAVTVTGGSGYLVGWIDWNNDGDFLDAGENIINQAVNQGVGQIIDFDVPAGTFPGTGGNLFFNARFRLFETAPTYPGNAYIGSTTNGEVEDYQWEFTPTAVTLLGFSARGAAGVLAAFLILALGVGAGASAVI